MGGFWAMVSPGRADLETRRVGIELPHRVFPTGFKSWWVHFPHHRLSGGRVPGGFQPAVVFVARLTRSLDATFGGCTGYAL